MEWWWGVDRDGGRDGGRGGEAEAWCVVGQSSFVRCFLGLGREQGQERGSEAGWVCGGVLC